MKREKELHTVVQSFVTPVPVMACLNGKSEYAGSSLARIRDCRTRENTFENPGIGSKLAKGHRIFSLFSRGCRQPTQR
jgi:hypothetical protein